MLSPYRVLDLTDEKGLFCGKLLADLGADVIKVEKPGGDPARKIGPFYHDEADPEKSLFWFAFNTNKRGITLDIETTEGQELFRRLVKTADFVIESFPPGYMDKLGLSYPSLEKTNPGIILVSITPFGQTGPYKDYKTSDLIAWAMGGHMYPYGDADRPPLHVSHHSQAYLHAALQAAGGALIALRHRQQTGEGQQVDVSIQEAVVRSGDTGTLNWDMRKVISRRGGGGWLRLQSQRRIWTCKDGYVLFFYHGGAQANRHNLPFIHWMDEEGMADEFLKGIDWDTFNFAMASQDMLERIAAPTGKFLMNHTKAELLEEAVKRRFMLYPVSSTRDIMESVQLAARDFWVKIEHPELKTTITYPGAFAKASGAPPRIRRRAPLIGEHNREIYEHELALSGEEQELSQAEVGKPEKKPLEGIKVLDFGTQAVGPITGKILAEFGAEVIKIEGRTRFDFWRGRPPFKDDIPGLNRSGNFNQDNTGKLSVALNLAQPGGVEIVKKLAARADVVVENFAGGVMDRMGLGYGELKKVKPDIIMLSASMQGQTGPHARHAGMGVHLIALAGFSYIAGWSDREPLEFGAYTDYLIPYFNALAILAALDHRKRTGEGQFIDVSHYEASLHCLAPLILDYGVNRRVAMRMGNRLSYAAPHGAYPCRGEDRWCVIAVFTDEEWRSFSRVIGNPAWTQEAKFGTLQGRKENEDELDKLVGEWTINHSAEEVMTLIQAAGVAAGVVATGEDLLEYDPQLKHRRFFRELDHPEVGKYRVSRQAFVLSRCPGELRPAPLLGEHNEPVLKKLLGMSDAELAELVIAGVIE